MTDGGLNHGFARAKVAGDAPDEAEDLFVRFDSVVDAGLNTTGQFGAPGDPRIPAVVQSGHCRGSWTRGVP